LSKKRGNGEGSISRRKGGGWMAQYAVHTAEGRKRRTLYGRTRAEVAAKLAKAVADRNGGLAFDGNNLTLGEYLDRWLSDSVRGSVRESTARRYEELSRLHIKPTLGRLKLVKLAPGHLRGLYQEKLEVGLSPRTVNYVHRTLFKSLKQATADGLVPRNVAGLVRAPRPTKKEIHPLNRSQVKAFFEAASGVGDRLEAVYVVAVHCGLRQGEILGLKWEDVDLEAGTLSVRRSLAWVKKEPILNQPKNGKGRSIRLTRAATEAFKRHRAAQNAERLRLGGLWAEGDLVFPGERGQPMRAFTLTGGSFKRLLKRAGLPEKTRFHDLRHTCATLLLLEGVHPKFVQELLGHATISITLDTYSHVLPGMGDQTAVAMERALI
jgi:integrase